MTSSGQIVMVFADGSFRTWAPGAGGWTTLAPAVGAAFADTVYILVAADSSGDGKQTLYAIGGNNSTSIVARFALP